MKAEIKTKIENWLERFEFVKWDRIIPIGQEYFIYGWIQRKDKYKDFLIISFDINEGIPLIWLSSSAKYDLPILEVFKHPETMPLALNNAQCKRVEDNFNIRNSITLENKQE